MSNLEDVLSDNADDLLNQQAAEAEQEQESSAAPDANAEEQDGHTEKSTGEEGGEKAEKPDATEKKDAPPASETEHHVPRKALEDERRKRQQLEQELLQARQARPEQTRQQQEQQEQLPPEVIMQQQLFNERLNMSEMVLRQQHDDVDAVIERFQQEVQKNPALGMQLQSQAHPYQWAYDYAKRAMVMDEIGSDPEAYKTRLREQLMAELQQQPAADSAATQAEKPNIPKSLANARSSAARSAPAWTGPTPLDDIVK